ARPAAPRGPPGCVPRPLYEMRAPYWDTRRCSHGARVRLEREKLQVRLLREAEGTMCA
ncbi:hypothetical protein GMDG_08863, partial [Pseudogymnoascus destructans 20631-21]